MHGFRDLFEERQALNEDGDEVLRVFFWILMFIQILAKRLISLGSSRSDSRSCTHFR